MRPAPRRPALRRAPAAALVGGVLAAGLVAVGVVPATGSTAASDDASASSSSPSSSSSSGSSGAAGTAVELGETVTTSEGVEVTTYGTVRVTPFLDSTAEATAYQALHAVQRVGERTVVYFSVGWLGEYSPYGYTELGLNPAAQSQVDALASVGFVSVAAPEQGVLLYAVPDPDASIPDVPEASSSRAENLPEEPGQMAVLFTVLPALPDGVETVDVTLGHAGVVTDVPVGDGLLEPTAAGPVVPVGSGWPEVPERFLDPVTTPDFSVRPLAALTEDIDGFSREAEAGEQVTLDIAADVLFAFDSADLTPEAVARLQEVAAEVAARAAPGRLGVIGHTDSNADDAYNDDLSRRRAQAVADVLAPALAGAGLEIAVEGRGEREPVADNGTDAGRALNRRVTVSFTETAGEG